MLFAVEGKNIAILLHNQRFWEILVFKIQIYLHGKYKSLMKSQIIKILGNYI